MAPQTEREQPTPETRVGSLHYFAGGIEVLDVLQAKMTPEQYEGFLLGNIIKYALRYNFKEARVEDLHKCKHYCELLLGYRERLEAKVGKHNSNDRTGSKRS